MTEEEKSMTIWKELNEEWNAPDEEKAALIRSEGVMTKADLNRITNVCVRYGLPLSGVNIIPSSQGKNIYINSEGIRWKLHTDNRQFKGADGGVIHYPTKEEPWITARARVEMHDGSFSENEAIIDWDWERVTERGTGGTKDFKDKSFSFGNLCMKLITKAKRRAGVELVGVGLPVYDEWLDKRDEIVDASWKIVKDGKIDLNEVPSTIPKIMAMAFEKYGMSPQELILQAVKTDGSSAGELSEMDIAKTWERIGSASNKKETA